MRRTFGFDGQGGWFASVSFVLVCCAVAAVLLSPTGIGPLVLAGTILMLIAALGSGPLLRRARPLRVWGSASRSAQPSSPAPCSPAPVP